MTVALNYLEKNGRFPPTQIQVQRVSDPKGNRDEVAYVREFLSYRFTQSMLIPVDAFSFSFYPPTNKSDRALPVIDALVREGDIITMWYGPDSNRQPIMTGLVDSTSQVCTGAGESFSIMGRDLLGQLEDQDAVSFGEGKAKTIWGANLSIETVVRKLIVQTRIADAKVRRQGIDNKVGLCATSPGESKLAALLRFLEPLNALVWMDTDGTIVVGKPNFKAPAQNSFFVDRDNGQSNCLQMKVTKNAGRIPNGVLGIWAGAELAQDSFADDVVENPADRCSALRKAGHIINKTVVVSPPDGNIGKSGSALNTLAMNPDDYVKAYVKRLIARANVNEVEVEVLVPGHANDNGDPYLADTVAHIFNDRATLDEDMYCYAVDYLCDQGSGQTTAMHFCRLGTIVADADAP